MQDSYGLKLDFTAAGEQLVTEEGEDFSLDGSFFLFEFLSSCDSRDFEFESAPIWLQVWASRARGLFFESNWNREEQNFEIKKHEKIGIDYKFRVPNCQHHVAVTSSWAVKNKVDVKLISIHFVHESKNTHYYVPCQMSSATRSVLLLGMDLKYNISKKKYKHPILHKTCVLCSHWKEGERTNRNEFFIKTLLEIWPDALRSSQMTKFHLHMNIFQA